MEKIKLADGHEYLHQALGVSDERAEQLGKKVGEIVDNAEELGILTKEDDGKSVNGNKLFEKLVNEVAETETERLLVVMRFSDLVERIGSGGNPLEAMMRRIAEMQDDDDQN